MSAASELLRIDRARSAERIRREVETLTGPAFTRSQTSICRYAYTPEYRRTLDHFTAAFEQIGYTVAEDAVGNLVAQNVPAGERVFGLGSHCDSNRNGGPWDGTLGVVVALEVCRLAAEHALELPLRAISFLEEEGSGFGQMLLGSRIAAGRVTDADLTEHVRALDDGRPFAAHAAEAGYAPDRWREASRTLDDLDGWIETHIEQARTLQDEGLALGIVETIAGYVHADVEIRGRADHAGGTPMDARVDALAVAGEVVLELERRAREAGNATVGTVGELAVEPGLINAIPGGVRLSLDVRGPDGDAVRGVVDGLVAFAEAAGARRGATVAYAERQQLAPTPMDGAIVDALAGAAAAAGVAHKRMISGAAHDTMCVADRAPTAMLFVPCRDGISHAPDESADPADAALAAEVALNALLRLRAAR